MRKRHKLIYIWSFIIIGVVILSFLYTPLGGNFSNRGSISNQLIIDPTVNFESGIQNSVSKRKFGQYSSNYRSNRNFQTPSNYNYNFNGSSSSHNNSIGSGDVFIKESSTDYNKLKNRSKSESNEQNNNAALSIQVINSIKSKSNFSVSNNSTTTTITEPFTNVTPSNSTIQKASSSATSLQDPGDDPVNSLPIGKEFIPFLVFAVLFSIIIKIRK